MVLQISTVQAKNPLYLLIKTVSNSSNSLIHCKYRLAVFPSPAPMILIKLSLAGNKFFPARESLASDVPAGDEKTATFFIVY
jgi:hypothetical protein